MDYYMIMPDEETPILIGEESLKTFWPDMGFDMFTDMVINKPNLLESIQIKDSMGKVHSITDFLDLFVKNNWKIKT